ncbi:MAG: hypothetical protein GY757_40305, partial [bacterium]|nr:hypothetical protein [bacterium]
MKKKENIKEPEKKPGDVSVAEVRSGFRSYGLKLPVLTGLGILLVLLAIYLPALDIYLLRDDFEWLNSSYGALHDPSVLFQRINNFFRPMVKLSYLFNYLLVNTKGPLYSLTTIIIHLVNVLLLYI